MIIVLREVFFAMSQFTSFRSDKQKLLPFVACGQIFVDERWTIISPSKSKMVFAKNRISLGYFEEGV